VSGVKINVEIKLCEVLCLFKTAKTRVNTGDGNHVCPSCS